jgi:hypothetical protein
MHVIHAGHHPLWEDSVFKEQNMPQTIAIGSRTASASGWVQRVLESLSARWGWITGQVPAGVTPTLPTSRRWF